MSVAFAGAVICLVVGTVLSLLAYLPALAVAETIPPARASARAGVWLVALALPPLCALLGTAWALHMVLTDHYGSPHLTSGHPHLCTLGLLSSPDAPWRLQLVAWATVGLTLTAVVRPLLGAWRSARALARIGEHARASDRLILLQDEAPRVVTVGLLRPVVIASTGLLRLLTPAQLKAVVAHESAHVTRRDNLRETLATAAMTCLAIAPTAHLYLRYWREETERACDDAAARDTSPQDVAQAIRLLCGTVTSLGPVTPAASTVRDRLAESERRAARLHRLAEPDAATHPRMRPAEVAVIALGALGLLALLAVATLGQVGDSLRCLAESLLTVAGRRL